MSTILVVGATGTTGRQVLKKLSAINGIRIKAATRHPEKMERTSAVEYVEFDYTDKSTIQKAVAGVQKVFLVTPFVPDLLEYEKAVIEEIKATGIDYIVKLSVTGAESKNASQICRIHGQLETLITETGIPYTFLRPFSFMQNFSNHASYTIRSQNAFFQPTGDGKINSIDARDIAAVAIKALTEEGHDGKAYTLTGPEPISNYRAAEILSSVIEREIRFIDVSEDQAKKGMLDAGMPEQTSNWLLELYRHYKTGFMDRTTDEVYNITGVRPISFSQFAEDYKTSFQ